MTGLKRNPPVNASDSIRYIAADIARSGDLAGLDGDFDYLFFIVAPPARSEAQYRAIYEAGVDNLLAKFGAGAQPYWFFVSSTGVYSQDRGEWIDEDSPAEPKDICGGLIRQAELTLGASGAAHTVVRFSGIYGPGRESLLRRAATAPVIQQQPPYYTNRIHEQDCLGVLAFLLEQRLAGRPLADCYLASDDEPATLWEVMTWLAGQLRSSPPAPERKDGAGMNKRCANARLKALGYRFGYPGYRNGYGELIRAHRSYL